ncbi:MAG TPA: oxygen-independent coproporphyrinogen III oxidase [Methylomirabilota bacterium]|nr:oxygen-independent coproporphyrinogen III oxidase [Methylomirabilota bacterium]
MNAHHKSDHRLFDVIGRTVPRYTSYPTAPHFTTAVDGEVYDGWLKSAGRADDPVSLYLHIPFCRSICHYCGCATKATRRDEPISAYACVLRTEIARVARSLGRVRVSHIHWGGGTPNLLPAADFAAVMSDLDRLFDLSTLAEHAIELDPRHLTRSGARFLAGIGVNRASLGVQDFDPEVQIAIGRVQPLEQVEEAVAALRLAGISAINFDLIYGLPLQTLASIRRTAMHAAGLAPSRIALFGYAHVPWFRPHQKLIDDGALPGAATRLDLARIARETIDAFGYEAIGIDHFARPEDDLTLARDARQQKRNVQGYTTDTATVLVGFGATSIGRTPMGYAQNATAVGAWTRAVEEDRLPTERGRALTADDRLRADVIEQLLCYFDVDLAAVAARHGAAPDALVADIAKLAPLVAEGWVVVEGARVAIVDHGAELARVVASAFDAYLTEGSARHSVAV